MKSPKSTKSRHSSNRGDSSQGTDAASTLASSLPSVVCCDQRSALLNALVSKMVKETIFPKKQFIVLEGELDEKGKLARKCLAALQMEQKQWSNIRELVRKSLNVTRNNRLLSVRRSLERKSPS